MSEKEKFLSAIAPFYENWRFICITAVCASIDERWLVVGADAFLDVSEQEKGEKEYPNFPEYTFKIFRENFPISQLEQLLDHLIHGCFLIDDEEIIFKKFSGKGFSEHPNNFTFYGFLSQIFSDVGLRYREFPRCGLMESTDQIWNLLQKVNLSEYSSVDEMMCSLDRPYMSFTDFMRSVLNIDRDDFTNGTSAHVRVVAPVRVRLSEDSRLEYGKLYIAVEVDCQWSNTDVQVVVNSTEKSGAVETQIIELSKFSLRGEYGELCVFDFDKEAPNVWRVELFLRQYNRPLESRVFEDYSVLDGNPRLKVLEHFDPGGIIFNENLRNAIKDKKRNDRFETAVTLVFHACGMYVGHYGLIDGLKGEELDIMAYLPHSNIVLAIECTTEVIDNKGKLSKLEMRREKLKFLLPSHDIRPVLVTALSRDEVGKDLQEAGKRGIAVVAQEKLQMLVDKARFQEAPNDIVNFILNSNSELSIFEQFSEELGD